MYNNQSYWFVVREDQSNVIFSSNNVTIQNPQDVAGQEVRYIVDTGEKPYIQVDDGPVAVQEVTEECDNSQQKSQDNFWDMEKVKLLLTLSQEHKYNCNGKDRVPWHMITPVLGTTKEECYKKFWNLKKSYLKCLKSKRLGKDSKWPYFDVCQEFFQDFKPKLPVKVKLENWGDSKVKRFLTLYIENMHRFYRKECLQKDVWKEIAAILGTTEHNCYYKFKNLSKTYISIQEKGQDNSKTKWPYYQYFEKIYNSPDRKLEQWDPSKIRLLIDAFSALIDKFKDPKYQKKDLWKQIGHIVGEPPEDCDRKIRNMKHTYIKIQKKNLSGKDRTHWKYYNDFEKIYNDTPQMPLRYGEDYIKKLLTYYIENKHKLECKLPIKKKILWRGIASKLGLTPGQCDIKFRNLKQTYMRLLRQGKGNNTWWPYYSYFQQIYENTSTLNIKQEKLEIAPMNEVKRVLLSLQDKKTNDMFDKLVNAVEESNNIERERNRILEALLKRTY